LHLETFQTLTLLEYIRFCYFIVTGFNYIITGFTVNYIRGSSNWFLTDFALCLYFRSNSFDVCICIAVIHHLSTAARRLAAIKELARIIRPGGRILISVWALEQHFKNAENRKNRDWGRYAQTESKMCSAANHVEKQDWDQFHVSLPSERKSYPTNSSIETTAAGVVTSTINNVVTKQDLCSKVSNRGDDLDCQNNIHSDTKLVSHNNEDTDTLNTSTFSRVSSCDTDTSKADCTSEILSASLNTSSNEIETSTQECTGNTAASRDDSVKLKVNASRDVFEQQDLLIPWNYRGQKNCTNSSKELTCASDKHLVEQGLNSAGKDKVPKVYQRFYHVFKENELADECRKLEDITVVRCYYDKGNWCVELEKVTDY
jgi:hypothetical protein